MANPEHLKILKQGVDAWNAWRGQNPEICPDLSEADFSGAHLRRMDLHGANLLEADWANIAWTAFGDVDLSTVKGMDTMPAPVRSAFPAMWGYRTR